MSKGKAKKAVKAVVSTVKNDPQLMSAVKNVAKRVDKLADKMAGETNGPIQRLGRKAGAAVGAPGLGSLIGRGIGRIVGTGDYQVMMNSLIKPGSERGHSMSAVSASFGTRGDVVRVRKREFAGMLTSASTANAFTSQSFRLNPGNPKLFPWLSGVMPNGYEQWRPLGIVVELVSVASEYASGGTLGTFGVAIDYQGLDPPYSSKFEAENSDGAVSAKVSDCVMFGVECHPSKRPYNLLYVRQGGTPVNSSSQAINTYDLGNIQVFSQGVPSTNIALAEIWVTYDLEFEKQQLQGGFYGGGTTSWLYYNGSGVSGGNLFGTPANATQYGDLYLAPGVTLSSNGGVTGTGLTFPDWLQGSYVFTIYYQGTVAATIAYPTIGYGGNVSAITWLGTGGPNGPVINTNQAAPAAESVTHVMWSYFINILPATSAGGNTLSFGAATMPTGSVIMNVLLTQLAVPPGNANPGLAYLTASPW